MAGPRRRCWRRPCRGKRQPAGRISSKLEEAFCGEDEQYQGYSRCRSGSAAWDGVHCTAQRNALRCSCPPRWQRCVTGLFSGQIPCIQVFHSTFPCIQRKRILVYVHVVLCKVVQILCIQRFLMCEHNIRLFFVFPDSITNAAGDVSNESDGDVSSDDSFNNEDGVALYQMSRSTHADNSGASQAYFLFLVYIFLLNVSLYTTKKDSSIRACCSVQASTNSLYTKIIYV